jgi:DNA-binding response OmpR family regulator
MTCCPSCGYNLTRDEVIERDEWSIDPRGAVRFQGEAIYLPPALFTIMHTLATTTRSVRAEVLLNRMGSEAQPQVIGVLICRLRKLLRDKKIPSPIQTVWGRGYALGAAA